jgi:CheY-like chemotaxis protein/chemotaxis signal transduction protein
MSVPHLLLVDDSEAALALERSVLAQHYLLSTATDGVEALERVRRTRPSAVLLDLSMPRMDGEEVLARMRADPELADIPVIIVSSEKERGEACLATGAQAFIHKPYRKDDLLLAVGRVLADVRARTRKASIAVLPVTVGDQLVALDLAIVRTVVSMTETRPLPEDATHVREYFELYGEPVCVIDLAAQLEVRHDEPLVDRKLVVLAGGPPPALAVCVDKVREPIELPSGAVEVIDPRELLAPEVRAKLPALVVFATNPSLAADGDVL